MRSILPFLPIILVALSLPAAVQTEAPKPGATHIIQVFRTGPGQPRVRDASVARTAALRQVTGRTRPYQPPQPGEGAPKN